MPIHTPSTPTVTVTVLGHSGDAALSYILQKPCLSSYRLTRLTMKWGSFCGCAMSWPKLDCRSPLGVAHCGWLIEWHYGVMWPKESRKYPSCDCCTCDCCTVRGERLRAHRHEMNRYRIQPIRTSEH